MGSIILWRSSALTRRNLAYALAVVLPILSTIVTVRVRALDPYPFALYFVAMALVATLGGFWPTLLGLAVTVFFHSGILGQGVRLSEISHPDRFRYAFLFGCNLIVGVLSQRRLNSERKLAIALAELHERTDALVDSLHTSQCASWTLNYAVSPSFRWYSGSFPIFGRHYSELPDLASIIPFVHPDDQSRLNDLERSLRFTTEPLVVEFRCIWPNQVTHWLEMRGTRLPGRNPRWRGITVDITERRHAPAAILSPDSLAATVQTQPVELEPEPVEAEPEPVEAELSGSRANS